MDDLKFNEFVIELKKVIVDKFSTSYYDKSLIIKSIDGVVEKYTSSKPKEASP